MNFKDALKYISEINNYGSVLGLENMRLLMNMLGNPQNELSVIHIAGTNGKGSVGAFLNSVLMEAGYSVGRYVSPAVMDYREKFQINEEYISEDEFTLCLEKVKKCADEIWEKNKIHITVFEVETAVAFYWFYMKKCDAVLLEVGLGGSLDATNIINKSLLSIITSVSFDHMNFLGNTLYDIAKQKAGIIKENGSVLTLNKNQEVLKAISETCKEKNAELIHVSDELKNIRFDGKFQSFYIEGCGDFKLKLLGKFQFENACTAIKACEFLIKRKGFNISPENMKNGIFNAQWTGRFYTVSETPKFIVDGAHNTDAVKQLIENLDFYFSNKRFIYIMGVFKDKEYKNMVEISASKARKIYAVNIDNPRGLDNKILKKEIEKYNKNVYAVALHEAIKNSMEEAEDNDVIIAFGSLSYLGDTINFLQN
jgi:dihydrofolate synthase/folylpolyglutamate synthase